MKYKLAALVCLLVFLAFLYSVYVAARGSDRMAKDLLSIGTPRDILLAEFGTPTSSEVRSDGRRYETFAFAQCYSGAAKATRTVFRCLVSVRDSLHEASRSRQCRQYDCRHPYGVACIAPPVPWKPAVASPGGAFGDPEMAYQVRYDGHDRVEQVVLLNRE